MRFIMMSDLHLGTNIGFGVDVAKEQLKSLCSRIRTDVSPEEIVLFIIMGDIINAGDTVAFSSAKECLDCILDELNSFTVRFEFVPGNHDLPKGDITEFDKFISQYGTYCQFNSSAAYSKVYENVNFIFADSNLNRTHNEPGKIDKDAILCEIKNMTNLLFCHHGFTHDHGGSHDIIEGGDKILKELECMGINFAFHGHIHRSDITVKDAEITEIGCGTIFKDISSDMYGIQNQFSVAYISNGSIVRVERLMMSKDGSNIFPSETVYPEQKLFADPKDIEKLHYDKVSPYIERKILPHKIAIEGSLFRFLYKDQEHSLLDVVKKEEKILLLSDAGQGKSVELQNLAYELCKTSYFPFLYSLRNYMKEPIEDLLPKEYNKLPSHYRVLIFDGYDELSIDDKKHFEKCINKYTSNNSGVHVVISSRSNFCKSSKENESTVFNGFKIYHLCNLSSADIQSFLSIQGVDYKKFVDDAHTSGIWELMSNAFYLTKVCDIYLKSGEIPQKPNLMDKLIEISFDNDDNKFNDRDLESNYQDIIELLTKIAFSMQLMQQCQLDDRVEYQALFESKERDLIKYCGLFVKEGGIWRFIHNNFREYLAAKYLSKMELVKIVSFISNGKGIKPSWVNTLGYLTGLTKSGALLDWIASNAQTALVKFESDRVGMETRYQVFTSIFKYYEDRCLWFDDELCDEEELAHFSESDKSLSFLLDKISNPVNVVSQHLAINILRNYHESLFGRRDEVLKCLLNCCEKSTSSSKSTIRIAIYSICQLNLNKPIITEKLMELFGSSETDFFRLGMYEYLIETKELDLYVDYFIDGIKYVVQKSVFHDDRIGNESYMLVEGLKAMSTPQSISSVMLWFASDDCLDFYNDANVIEVLSKKASQLYANTHDELIYNSVLCCCNKSLKKYEFDKTRSCIEFFKNTDTLEKAILDILKHFGEDINYISSLVHSYHEVFNCILNAYKTNKFDDHEVFRNFSMHYADEDIQYDECSKALVERGKEALPERGPRINYEILRIKALHEYFEILFNRDKAKAMLDELLNKIGNNNILVKDLFDVSRNITYLSPLENLKFAIYHHAKKESLVSDFFDSYEFNRFTVIQSAKLLKNKKEIIVSEEQKRHLERVLDDYLGKDILISEVGFTKDTAYISELVHSLIFLSVHFDFSFDEEKMLDMTLISYYCFDETADKKYEYLKKHISLDKIKAHIENDLSINDLDNEIIRDHIDFCQKEKLYFATNKALELCKTDNTDTWVRSTALEYLQTLYGDYYIEENILPVAEGDFLLEIASKCKNLSRVKLVSVMEKDYEKQPTQTLMAYLIMFESEMAINAYTNKVVEENCTSDNNRSSTTPTRAIASINNPIFLPVLGKLVLAVFAPGFKDNDYFSLRSSLHDALIKCGKNSPEATIALIIECQSILEKSETVTRFCSYTIEEIKRNKSKDSDRPWSIGQVISFYKNGKV